MVLASSSSGNSTLVDTGAGHFLVDAGLSGREITRRLASASAHPRDLAAIVLTHEHTDHTSGVRVLAGRLGIPVFGTPGTLRAAAPCIGGVEARPEPLDEPFELAGASVTLLRVPHDAAEPAAVLVEAQGRRLLVATDLGTVPWTLVEAARDSHALVLESNHDLRMLKEGPYPPPLKQRILSDNGHLSNEQCAAGLRRMVGGRTRTVLLGHLSRQNNTPELALASARNVVPGNVEVRTTSPVRAEAVTL